jgi:ribosomal protein S18 acetylase RimI-like enzyme
MKIYLYTSHYEASFIALYQETFLKESIYREIWTMEQVQKVIAENEVRLLLDADVLVGFVCGRSYLSVDEISDAERYVFESKDITRAYYIAELVVSQDYRGKGYGKQLIEFCMKEGQSSGATLFILNTRIDNPASQLYERVGFQKVVDKHGSIITNTVSVMTPDGPGEYENLYMWLEG